MPRIASIFILMVAAGLLAAAIMAPRTGGGELEQARIPGGSLRLASLSPALTRLLVDAGYGESIVARSTFCTTVPVATPVAGDARSVQYETLLRVEPTHVFIQSVPSALEPALADEAARRGWRVVAIPRLDTLEHIRGAVRTVADALAGADPALRRRFDELSSSVGALESDASKAPLVGRRFLLVHDTDPVNLFGRGTWLSEAMEHLGGVNAVTEEGWLSISVEDARRLRADMIVVLAPGEVGEVSAGDLARGGEADVIVVRHADALLPTTSVVAVVEEIRRSIGRGARP